MFLDAIQHSYPPSLTELPPRTLQGTVHTSCCEAAPQLWYGDEGEYLEFNGKNSITWVA